MRTNELMLYKHMEEGQILQDMTFLMENYQNDYYNMEDMKGLLYDAVNEILEMAVSHGFEGDLWHNYLTYLMASHENAYSTSCEIVGPVDGSINQVALHDFEIFKELFDYDFADLENVMGVSDHHLMKYLFPTLRRKNTSISTFRSSFVVVVFATQRVLWFRN